MPPRLGWRANRAKRGWEGMVMEMRHPGVGWWWGCWAEGKSRAVGRWKEGVVLCLHPELLPDFREETLNHPLVPQSLGAHKVSTARKEMQVKKCR